MSGSSRNSAPSLTLAEGVALAHHVVGAVADQRGIRALMIKGPVLALQDLRTPRESVDVDVLVEPARRDELVRALVDLGWQDEGRFESPTVLRRHSVVVRHPTWPCELDVHDYYPGFLADPAVVFDLMWGRRESVVLAGQPLACPDRAAHAALAGLHYLRDGAGIDSPPLIDLRERIEAVRGLAAAVSEVARHTGATETLRPLLESLGAVVERGDRDTADLRRWRLVTEGRFHGVAWIVELQQAPWRRRPGVLRRAVWPSTAELRRHTTWPLETPRQRRDARVRRLRRGAQALPAALRDVRDNRLS